MGDMLTLIEQAEKAFDAEQAEKMAAKLASGEDFTLEDFLEQMQLIRKMGPIGNLLGMLPGHGPDAGTRSTNIDDRDLDRIAAIIQSMTPAERRDPKIINGSRRARIAKRFRRRGQRGQQPGRAVLRGAEDDAPDGRRHGHARHAGHAAARRPRRPKKQEQEGQAAQRRPAQARRRGKGRKAAAAAAADAMPQGLPPGLAAAGRLPPGGSCRPVSRCPTSASCRSKKK